VTVVDSSTLFFLVRDDGALDAAQESGSTHSTGWGAIACAGPVTGGALGGAVAEGRAGAGGGATTRIRGLWTTTSVVTMAAAGVVGSAVTGGGAVGATTAPIPAGSEAVRPAERSVTDHRLLPTTTTTATAPKASHGSRKRRRLRLGGACTLGTITVRAGSVRSMLGSTPPTSRCAPSSLHGATSQLARFSGGGAAASAAARSFTDAAYMST
jgi:hypothetical protein